jgi:hypothetical protein
MQTSAAPLLAQLVDIGILGHGIETGIADLLGAARSDTA